MALDNSILNTTKAALGVELTDTDFDAELLTHINSVLSDLTQLGVGPQTGFFVTDDLAEWGDMIGEEPRLFMIKSYVFNRVKLFFDPPSIGFVLTAMKDQIEKAEWRIAVVIDTIKSEIPI